MNIVLALSMHEQPYSSVVFIFTFVKKTEKVSVLEPYVRACARVCVCVCVCLCVCVCVHDGIRHVYSLK